MPENDPLAAFWMPFTANRAFKTHPRLLVSAKDMHYQSADIGESAYAPMLARM